MSTLPQPAKFEIVVTVETERSLKKKQAVPWHMVCAKQTKKRSQWPTYNRIIVMVDADDNDFDSQTKSVFSVLH